MKGFANEIEHSDRHAYSSIRHGVECLNWHMEMVITIIAGLMLSAPVHRMVGLTCQICQVCRVSEAPSCRNQSVQLWSLPHTLALSDVVRTPHPADEG